MLKKKHDAELRLKAAQARSLSKEVNQLNVSLYFIPIFKTS